MIRVAVVDDQELIRDGFSLIVNAHDDMAVALTASNGRELLDRMARAPRLDVVLMDIRMPVLDGIETTRIVQQRDDAPAVLVVTTFGQDEYVLDAIAAGASGFVLKRCSSAELVDAIRAVAAGRAHLSPDVTNAVLERVRRNMRHHVTLERYELTPRESEVLHLIGAGMNNPEIAQHLYLSISSVKKHVGNVLAKTRSRDRVQAAILAIRSNA